MKSLRLLALVCLFFQGASATELNFREAFLKLKGADPRLAAEAAQVAASETNVLAAKLSFLPSLRVDLERRWQGSLNQRSRYDGASATAGLNLFAFGRDYFNLKASKRANESTLGRYERVELEVEKEIYTALLELLYARENVEIYTEIEKLKQDLLEVSDARFKRGLDPSSELLRAEVEVANARAQTEGAKSTLALARAALGALTDEPVELARQWPLESSKRKELVQKLKEQNFELAERPDYVESAKALEATEYQQKSLFAEYLPELNFSVARGYTENVFDEWETTYLLSVSFPIFSRGETLVKRANLATTQAQYTRDLLLTKRRAKEEYNAELANLERGRQTLEARLKTLGLSTKLYQENLRLFKAGRRALFELLLDQERMLTSKQLASLGQREFYASLMNVCLARGQSLTNCLF